MGESVSEGIIARWVKAVGDPVKEGETVVEVTTDKVDVEVPSPASGRLAEILVKEGDTVDVGATLAMVEPGAASDSVPTAPIVAAVPPPEVAAPALKAPALEDTQASPLARRAAAI